MLRRMEAFEAQLRRGTGWAPGANLPADCPAKFKLPTAPLLATEHNGIHLPAVCFRSPGPHRVFVISDWGGLVEPGGPRTADQRPAEKFVPGVDDRAQVLVARQMQLRAASRSPDYILNGGDSFYWGGLEIECGKPSNQIVHSNQLQENFEKIYTGNGLDGKPWLGVLGNHDYGGYQFNKGWDQLISYSWTPGGRWVMPAQYWRQTVRYPGFAVDYYFLDTNIFDVTDPHVDPIHNICGTLHNTENATCGVEGPLSVMACPKWFFDLWEEQKQWIEAGLSTSDADWQILVTHFPPTWEQDFWISLARRHGVDLFVAGHMHRQKVYDLWPANFLHPTVWLVSGGGGGITSEGPPDPQGEDDEYGFFELTLTKDEIEIQGISHGGKLRSTTF